MGTPAKRTMLPNPVALRKETKFRECEYEADNCQDYKRHVGKSGDVVPLIHASHERSVGMINVRGVVREHYTLGKILPGLIQFWSEGRICQVRL